MVKRRRWLALLLTGVLLLQAGWQHVDVTRAAGLDEQAKMKVEVSTGEAGKSESVVDVQSGAEGDEGTEPEVGELTGVRITNTETYVKAGETYQMTYESVITPEGAVYEGTIEPTFSVLVGDTIASVDENGFMTVLDTAVADETITVEVRLTAEIASTHTFTVAEDGVAPVIDEASMTMEFGVFSISVTDNLVGVRKVYLSLDDDTYTEMNLVDGKYQLQVAASGTTSELMTFYIKAEDEFGNMSDVTTFTDVLVDTIPPEIIRYNRDGEEAFSGIYSDVVDYVGEYEIIDDNLDLGNITYSCMKDGAPYTEFRVEVVSQAGENYRARLYLNAGSGDGEYIFTVEAKDTSGLGTGSPIWVTIDTVAPIISDVSRTTGFTMGEDYECYKGDRKAVVSFKVTEEGRYPLQTLKAALKDVNGTTVKTFALRDGLSYDADTQLYSFTLPQGIYSGYTITAVDAAGLEDVYVSDNERTLVVDNTTTKLTKISLSGGQTIEGAYYVEKNGIAEFTLTEPIFFPELWTFNIYKYGSSDVLETLEYDSSYDSIDGDVHTFRVPFSLEEEGAYYVEIVYQDVSLIGSVMDNYSKKSGKIVNDFSAPDIRLISNAEKGSISNKNVEIEIYLDEQNPDFTKTNVNLVASNNLGNLDTACRVMVGDGVIECANTMELKAALKNAGNWTKTDTGYKAKVVLYVGGQYLFSIAGADNQGSTTKMRTFKVTVDKNAPGFEALDIDATKLEVAKDGYDKFANKSVDITVTLKEKDTDVEKLVCIATDEDTGKATKYEVTAFDVDAGIYTGTVTIKKNFKGYLSFIATDKAGNERTYDLDGGLIVEGEKKHIDTSTASIDLEGEKNENGFYSADVLMGLEVRDTYSGLKEVTYAIEADSKTVTMNSDKLQTYWKKKNVLIDADQYNGNGVKLTLSAVDNAGNTIEEEKTIKIDSVNPEIEITYDNNAPRNERYYNLTRTATIVIKEYNLDPDAVVITATQNGSVMNIEPNFSWDGEVYEEDGIAYKRYVMTVPFSADGDYELTVSCSDLADNKSELGRVDRFTIDQTNPEIAMTFNNNQAAGGLYYGESRTATITVTEHNFDSAAMVVEVTRTVEGAGATAPTVSGFSSNGDTHTATISFAEEGEYTVSVTGMDLAGNEGNTVTESQFIIDLTVPEIEITNVSEGYSYNDQIAPVVKITDNNYDNQSVSIHLIGGKNREQEAVYTKAQTVNGEVYTFADFIRIAGVDDTYTLQVTARDLAGHEATKVVEFNVNRFGSYYEIADTSRNALANYYINGESDIQIFEYNVDSLKEYHVYYSLNGEIVQLVEGKDFTVDKVTNSAKWSQYTYNISGKTFHQEGIYLLSVSSEDASGNVSDNKVKGVEIEFCIDKTAPSCVVTGIEDGTVFEKDATRQITIDVFDNIMLESVQVQIDNAVFQEVKAEDMEDGKLTLILPKSVGVHLLQITSKDVAGNISKNVYEYTIDGGVENNQMMMVVSIVMVALIVLILILAAVRKKSRKTEE